MHCLKVSLTFDLEPSRVNYSHAIWSSEAAGTIESIPSNDLCWISTDDLSLLEIDTLHTIISNESLQIESENWLLRVLVELGNECCALLD
jgi:hypothetical protein